VSPGLIVTAERSDSEAKYRSRNPVVRHLTERFLRRVVDLVATDRPRRVLEVGCGEGMVISRIARRYPGIHVDGLELDAGALAEARARCPAVPLVRGDACALPVRSGSYDLVVCLEVLEHLPDPARALEELLRVTRRACLLSVPHEPFFRLGNLLRGQHLARLGNPSDHLQHWGRREFAALCRRYFTVRACANSFPWLIVYGTR
jgi:ubiquinone/menaquinone biosynthesis C-methylase UbiE